MRNSTTEEVAVLDDIYAARFSDDAPEHLAWRRDLWQVLVDDFFRRWIPPQASVLDYGSGRGEFINAVEADRKIGVDLRASAAGHLASDVEFILARDGWTSQVGHRTVDVVFCSNLLEHLPGRDAVTALFAEFREVLKPTGRLLILGPNLRYTGFKYWDFFDHLLPLTHLSLIEALVAGGFHTEKMIPRFLPYTTVGGTRFPLAFVRWYLRLPIAWRWLGAQFFAVARPRDFPEAGNE